DCLVVGDLLPSGGLWIRIKSTPVFDDAGNVSGAVNILHNITDLKRASERIHALYNNAPCGYQALDDSGTIVDMNQTGLDWIGYSRNEIVGKAKLESLLTE